MATATRTIQVGSARDLLTGLMDPELRVRLAVVQAIRQQPEAALAYGAWHGRDVVDELLHQAYQDHRHSYWREVLETLAGFAGPRVVAYFTKLLLNTERPELMATARRRLEREPVETVAPVARAILRRDRSTARAREAAFLLYRRAELTPAEQLRVELLTGDRLPGERLEDGALPIWRSELTGPHQAVARERLEALGSPAFRLLKRCADELDDETRSWFLAWGARAHGAEAVEPLLRGMEADSASVRRVAVEALLALGPGRCLFSPALERLAVDPDESVRAAVARVIEAAP